MLIKKFESEQSFSISNDEMLNKIRERTGIEETLEFEDDSNSDTLKLVELSMYLPSSSSKKIANLEIKYKLTRDEGDSFINCNAHLCHTEDDHSGPVDDMIEDIKSNTNTFKLKDVYQKLYLLDPNEYPIFNKKKKREKNCPYLAKFIVFDDRSNDEESNRIDNEPLAAGSSPNCT